MLHNVLKDRLQSTLGHIFAYLDMFLLVEILFRYQIV